MSPTYEYRCNKCLSFTVLRREQDERDDEVTCVCGNNSDRIYNVPSIQFKGSGFYRTDNQ